MVWNSSLGYRSLHRHEACVGCVQLEEDLRVLRHEIRQSGETGVQLPVNFRRLIWNAQKIFKCKPHRPSPSGTLPILSLSSLVSNFWL